MIGALLTNVSISQLPREIVTGGGMSAFRELESERRLARIKRQNDALMKVVKQFMRET